MVNRKKSGGKLLTDKESSLPLFNIDDCPASVPAAGYRNGTSLNNAGENGNYWSATPNEDNTDNAYELNFNSGNFNRNWNNRNNGQTVRPVSELTQTSERPAATRHYHIRRERLLADLYRAYKDARRHKQGKDYQLRFEYRLEDNLVRLCDELYSRTYIPRPSTCFVIHDPKMREVFAADFRDRIVHHLFYNYTHTLFERTFIADSYSCIKERGTHYGIKRLRHHIRSASSNYSYPVYILKIDISGYFMHIDRSILLSLCNATIEKMAPRSYGTNGKPWRDVVDENFVRYLLERIINADITENCRRLGKEEEWALLPPGKSIFHSPEGCGLPIGNLSSQLFSNVYMNAFDQFVKRDLGCKHYGRYVDDCYIVDRNSEHLRSLVQPMKDFLRDTLRIEINLRKLRIDDANYGTEFLGAYVKPFRTYISNSALHRIKHKVTERKPEDCSHLGASVNSYLGVLSHYKSYRIRRVLFGYSAGLNNCGYFGPDWLTFRPFGKWR